MSRTPSITPSTHATDTSRESAAGEEDPGAAIAPSAAPVDADRLPEGHPAGEKVPCPGCDGVGHDDGGKPCSDCDGKGTVTIAAVKPQQ
ncbi:hypothetical protein ACSFA3_15650 [Variovorax sp. RHLX14]|uniref:hypothetical protein n=1 Tax=Variovorax sp. RHLX14 TaxID=1259731 RepID=UPI003F4461D3